MVAASTFPSIPRDAFATGLLVLLLSSLTVAFCPESRIVSSGVLKPLHEVGLYIFKDQATVQLILYIGIGIHVVESLFAAHICRKHSVPLPHSLGWIVLTLVYGFPALEILMRRTDILHSKEN
mmetsp:Transcript_22767/g.57105  ORF Transcript_22767/g.57105 Transcript_22767/m.57105 type:complete len:123 (-) Transcript_22767:8-376(-)